MQDTKKYEYKVATSYSEGEMEVELEVQGDRGWELVYAYQRRSGGLPGLWRRVHLLVFKRERGAEPA